MTGGGLANQLRMLAESHTLDADLLAHVGDGEMTERDQWVAHIAQAEAFRLVLRMLEGEG